MKMRWFVFEGSWKNPSSMKKTENVDCIHFATACTFNHQPSTPLIISTISYDSHPQFKFIQRRIMQSNCSQFKNIPVDNWQRFPEMKHSLLFCTNKTQHIFITSLPNSGDDGFYSLGSPTMNALSFHSRSRASSFLARSDGSGKVIWPGNSET